MARQAEVVVGLAVVDQQSRPLALAQAVVQVVGHLDGMVVLEQLRVSPLHAAPREQGLGGLPAATQTFQQEDGLRVGLVDLGGDVLPGGQRHHVPGIAAEAVHAAAAPHQQGPGHHVPQGRAAVVQLHQVLPGGAPGARAVEGAVGVAPEPVRLVLQQAGAPARVVHEDVEEHLPAPPVDGLGQLPELLLGGGAAVKVHQGGVDGREVQLGVGAAEAAHAGVGGGHGPHGQQVQNAAAQALEDVGHGCREVAQAARGGDDGIARFIQSLDGPGELRHLAGRSPAEHAREGAVDGVGGAQAVGVDREAGILARGPVLETLRVHAVGLGAEAAGLGEGQVQDPAALCLTQRDVAPGGAARIAVALPEQGHRLGPHGGAPGEVGAQEGPPTGGTGGRVRESERHAVPHEAEQLGARRRGHGREGHGGSSHRARGAGGSVAEQLALPHAHDGGDVEVISARHFAAGSGGLGQQAGGRGALQFAGGHFPVDTATHHVGG